MLDYLHFGCRRSFFCIMKMWIVLFAMSAILVPARGWPQRRQPPNCAGGTLDAPIRMEIFSDFQCPGCRTFYLETVTQILKNYASSNKVCVIYHEFPLASHLYSAQAASYSLAAQRVGRKQWLAVLDALYVKQPEWSQNGNIDAALIGVVSAEDLIKIKTIAFEKSIEKAIIQEIALGQKKEVKVTPTVFWTALNKEQKVDQLYPYQKWKGLFDLIVK